MQKVQSLAQVGVLIALYYLTYYLYYGLLNPLPPLGDSWEYHIPIAKTILDGRFLFPHDFGVLFWYPGAAEMINALFLILPVPLSYSNIFATCVLFFALWKLGRVFGLSYYFSLLFSVTFVTLNVVVRWLNFVTIDMWLAVFFVFLLILLENPKRSIRHFLLLGFFWGIFLGSKYTAPAFSIVLLIFYIRELLPFLNISRIIAFLIPFSLFGLFWYIRNYFYTNNPFYPLSVPGFQGEHLFGSVRVWNATLAYPRTMFDSAFAEYKVWIFVVPFALGFVIYRLLIKKTQVTNTVTVLFLLGLANFILYFFFPTSKDPWIMVSSFRYSFPAFIPLMLGVFLLAKHYKKEEWLGYFAIGNMIMVTSLLYYPKLVLLYIPLAGVAFYLLNRYKPRKSK